VNLKLPHVGGDKRSRAECVTVFRKPWKVVREGSGDLNTE